MVQVENEDSPDFVLESGQEACGDAEPRVQEVLFFRRLQDLQVCVKFLWNHKGNISQETEGQRSPRPGAGGSKVTEARRPATFAQTGGQSVKVVLQRVPVVVLLQTSSRAALTQGVRV